MMVLVAVIPFIQLWTENKPVAIKTPTCKAAVSG